MLAKTINYTDFNGDTHSETFYFHLSKRDLVEMSLDVIGTDLSAYLENIVASNNPSEILHAFQEILAASIGVKSEDGKRFIKNDEIRQAFLESNAYEELFMELMTNEKYAAEFIQGILPSDLAEKAVEARNEPKEWTHQELLDMDSKQFEMVAGHNPKDMSRDHLLIAMERKNRV